MKAFLKFVVAVTGVGLLGFAIHDMVSFGMGVSSSVSRAPQQFWDALEDAITWGIQYKVEVTVAFVVGLIILYLWTVPPIKSK